VTFVDTSFWAAVYFPRDQRHEEATQLLRALDDAPLVTSNHVRGETWTLLRRRVDHRTALHFLDRTARSERISLMFVSEELEQDAIRWLRRRNERPYSFVDATSFALMRSLKIRDALAFDNDFSAAGFVELRAS
jgi:predicted nucleic acid-binding protein